MRVSLFTLMGAGGAGALIAALFALYRSPEMILLLQSWGIC
ncbi:MAG: hypothetical protein AAFU41_00130 [Pseudomonadota bacterium]